MKMYFSPSAAAFSAITQTDSASLCQEGRLVSAATGALGRTVTSTTNALCVWGDTEGVISATTGAPPPTHRASVSQLRGPALPHCLRASLPPSVRTSWGPLSPGFPGQAPQRQWGGRPSATDLRQHAAGSGEPAQCFITQS